jgi:hypothetical protein
LFLLLVTGNRFENYLNHEAYRVEMPIKTAEFDELRPLSEPKNTAAAAETIPALSAR